MAKLELTKAALDDLRKLDGSVRVKVAAKLRRLEEDPNLGAPLSGELHPHLRVKASAWRIIYHMPAPDHVVVWCIGPRRNDEVYQEAKRRLSSCDDGPRKQAVESLVEVVREKERRAKARRRIIGPDRGD